MKRILLTLLVILLLLGAFAATGYAGYRFGYAQGVQSTANGENPRLGPRPFDDFGPRGVPNFGFGRDFRRGFGPGRFPMIRFGYFPPLMFLGQLVVLALIVFFIYWLFTRSSWQLTRTVQTTETQSKPTATETKE
jgi:hypothetical protein